MKVGSIVEEATRMGKRSDKMREEERREVEEKVVWRFQKNCSLPVYPQVARFSKSSNEEKGRQLSWSWNNKSQK